MRGLIQLLAVILAFILLITVFAFGQYAPREDVIWARNVNGGSLTMDGMLNEPEWAMAESLHVSYGDDPNGSVAQLPTSGSRPEFQAEAISDPTRATVKFLVDGSYLYMGFIMPDSSVGGTQDWARWDGILMSVKDRASENRPTPAVEFFYTWWYVNVDTLVEPGAPPRFIGRYGNFGDTTRTEAQKAAWDARTVVHGMANDDSEPDSAWVVEMRINLDSLGYDATKPEGEIVELNFSIWDQDWVFGGDPNRITSMRSWWQSPWGNANADNVGRVHIRSDVTVNSGEVPQVEPDVIVPSGEPVAEPTIDGTLDEEAWAGAYTFEIRFGDNDLRNSYPGVGPWRSGQFQPDLDADGNTPLPQVLDTAHAVIKMFFKDDYLYLGADVNDQLVQGVPRFDEMDGVRFIIGDREALDADNRMLFRQLMVVFDSTGNAAAMDYLPVMVDSGWAEWASSLKGATTVNDGNDVDEGFTVEMRVNLTGIGYPSGLGDMLLFMGVTLLDGDSFDDPANNYGTRTWWFREHNGGPAAAWMVMDPNTVVGIGDDDLVTLPDRIELFGNYPNPFNPTTTINYSIPSAGEVILQVFDVLGRNVAKINAGQKAAGTHELNFDAAALSSGIYFYKIQLKNSNARKMESQVRKMVLLR